MDFLVLEGGDGFSMFKGDPILQDRVKIDNQVLMGYVINTLDGDIGTEYADPYGQGRILFTED